MDIKFVLEKSEEMANSMKKAFKIDSIMILNKVVLIMEDIYEKLNLIDYKDSFCKSLKMPLISKFYFALNEENDK